jgi:hypothetical protein
MTPMTPDEPQEERAPAVAPRSGSDRRGRERRARDRRAPALVSYGLLGALGLVSLWNVTASRPSPAVEEEPLAMEERREPQQQIIETQPSGGVEEAFGAEGFARLMVEGDAAQGRLVRAELFCGPATHFTVIQSHPATRSVAALIQEGRVPAAECKWGQRSEGQSRPDFLLLIPPEGADAFASAPVVTDSYVERRRVVAELEWVGRTEHLALRTAGVLRRRNVP